MTKEKATASVRKSYSAPVLHKWGTVADLTHTGTTQSGADAKGGSVTHSSGQ